MPEGLQPVGRTHIGEVHGEPSPMWWDPMAEQDRVRRSPPPPEEEGAVETRGEEPTPAPVPLRRRGEEGERTGSGAEAGRREGWEEGVLWFGFTSHYPWFDLIGSKIN